MGLTLVANAELATIVTTLDMTIKPALRPMPSSSLSLARWAQPSPDKYRALFKRVGAPWLWFSRLVMSDAALIAIIHDPGIEISAVVDRAGIEIGMLELDFRHEGACELGYFGLIPELAGQGHGRWLMAHALSQAWRSGVSRVWVHTCTLDHPSALGFYQRQGFTAISRCIETFPDPRLTGILPRDIAPQIPLLGAAADSA